jgi:Zn-dependent peptidase ImmA (M78 family)
LGHLISSRTAPQVLLIDATFKTREEKYADAFGRAFLMPAREVIQKFNEITAGMKKLTRRHVILLGHHFAVSREATVRRLEELELVKKGTWDWFSMHGGITNEQVTQVLGSLASETENADGYSVTELRLHQLAAEVYRQALMSEGQLARLLKIDRPELRSILDSQQLDEEGAACDILT